eukprot:GEMP01083675.1.p1 GENE.GEMP01083675.1~~GEMP01083675.1.p1  ORF type:complete len:197 (+),score=53.76 GEMP01083675.1:28-618(+)
MADDLLLHACSNDDFEEAMALVASGLANVNCASRVGTTPLHAATQHGSAQLVRGLLDFRAEPNSVEVTTVGGKSCLHLAVELRHADVAMMLLQACAQPSIPSATGMTPLHCAAVRNCPDAAVLLLAFSADPHIRDYQGHNAAHWAAEFNSAKVLDALMNAGAPPRKILPAEYCAHVKKNQPGKEKVAAKQKVAKKK